MSVTSLRAVSSNPSPSTVAPPAPAAVEAIVAALGASRDIVALYDGDEWLRYANPAYRALFLRGAPEPIRFPDVLRLGFTGGFGVKVGCGDVERFLADILPRRRALPHRSIEVDTVDGRWLWITETLLPDGWLLSVGSDITRLKHDEKTLRRSQAELAAKAEALHRSNEELEQFAYAASHDLQEPLRTVAGFTQLLARRHLNESDPSAREFVTHIVDGVKRMQSLIQDLLAYSRVTGRALAPEPTDLTVVLHRALANLDGAIRTEGAVVTHDPLPTLRVDPSQLMQVFQNLLSNALKFRSAGGAHVHVSARQQNDEWLIAVRDDGIGIDAAHLAKLFVIFQRLHSCDEYPGSGVGLALCRKIVGRHGGRIWAESPGAGRGATFSFALPA